MRGLQRLIERAGPALVLRAFLGVTFTFAGLQKLANPNFFRANAPGSFQSQVHGALSVSPIAPLLRLSLHAALPLAVVIAVAEVAVGLGTLAGCFARLAATGGGLLSLTFFLSISWGTSPYYYGSDIVFFFAWTVLALGGAGPWSLDARRAADPATANGVHAARRAFLSTGVASVVGVAVTGVVVGADAAIGRALSGGGASNGNGAGAATTPSTAPSSGGTGGSSGSGTAKPIMTVSSVGVGNAAAFTDPESGTPGFVVHDAARGFVAFSAICTHAGCTVGFQAAGEQFVCPCHGSIYQGATGAVVQGPATLPLPAIGIEERSDGIYLTGS